MSDPSLIREVLSQILMGARRIERRAASVLVANDFLDSDAGLDKLDAICMMLIAIGESVKNLDKITAGKLLPRFPQVDWKGVKGVRDVISHQYVRRRCRRSGCDLQETHPGADYYRRKDDRRPALRLWSAALDCRS